MSRPRFGETIEARPQRLEAGKSRTRSSTSAGPDPAATLRRHDLLWPTRDRDDRTHALRTVTMSTATLSVVMPAYNETGLLEESVHEIIDGLRARQRSFEVLVIENGSSDGTAALARRLADELDELRTWSLPAADYGAALRDGILAATGDVVVTFDVDYFDFDFLDAALASLATDDELAVVVGSKRAPGADDRRPWTRRFVTAAFSELLRLGFGLKVSDTHGMKALRRRAIDPLARQSTFGTDLFDTELMIRVERAGLQIAVIGVTVEERRPSRTPVGRRVLRTLGGLVRLRRQLRSGH